MLTTTSSMLGDDDEASHALGPSTDSPCPHHPLAANAPQHPVARSAPLSMLHSVGLVGHVAVNPPRSDISLAIVVHSGQVWLDLSIY